MYDKHPKHDQSKAKAGGKVELLLKNTRPSSETSTMPMPLDAVENAHGHNVEHL